MSKVDNLKKINPSDTELKENFDRKILEKNIEKIEALKNLSASEKQSLIMAIESMDIFQIMVLLETLEKTKEPDIITVTNFLKKDLLNYFIEHKPSVKQPDLIHEEMKFFRKSEGKFTLLFANRLSIIKKNELHTKILKDKPIKVFDEKINGFVDKYENYTSFKNYVEDEFGIAENTAYTWINISDYYFNDLAKSLPTSEVIIQNTKFEPSISLLQSDKLTKHDKEKVKKTTIDNLGKTVREIRLLMKDFKIEYGLEERPKDDSKIDEVIKNLDVDNPETKTSYDVGEEIGKYVVSESPNPTVGKIMANKLFNEVSEEPKKPVEPVKEKKTFWNTILNEIFNKHYVPEEDPLEFDKLEKICTIVNKDYELAAKKKEEQGG